MTFDSSFRGQMESLVPVICRERMTMSSVLQQAVAECAQNTLRLIFVSPQVVIPPTGGAVTSMASHMALWKDAHLRGA